MGITSPCLLEFKRKDFVCQAQKGVSSYQTVCTNNGHHFLQLFPLNVYAQTVMTTHS